MEEENRLIRFDWAMKNMLRDKANFDILEGFLSALLKEDITTSPPYTSTSPFIYSLFIMF